MSAAPLSGAYLKSKGYVKGSIVRVRMVNFITYDEAEVFPGPRLNVILGPNGSGKSTLTHAICLACGGKISTVGRSGDLNQFVKKGKEDAPEGAFIEIDVLKGEAIITIRRELSGEDNTSKWWMNKKSSTKLAVKALMAELSIDVDNLCSFMAQDKVGNFTLQTPKEMLQTTLKSIKNDKESKTLYEIQMELVDVEAVKITRKNALDVKIQQIDRLRQQIEGMRPEIERMEQRKIVKKTLDLYDIKKMHVCARQSKDACLRLQASVDEANDRLKQEQAAQRPLKDKERELEKQQLVEEKAIANARGVRKKSEDALRGFRERLDDADIEVMSCEVELTRLTSRREQLKKRVADFTAQAEREQITYNKLASTMPKLEQKLNDIDHQLNEKRENMQYLENELSDLNTQLGRFTGDKKRLDMDLTNLKDPRTIFKAKLHGGKIQDHVKKAMEWLDNSSNQGRFEGQVLGPVAFYVKVKSKAHAAILENAIGWGKMHLFLVESRADQKVLTDTFKNLGLNIDTAVINHRETRRGDFKPTILSNAYSFGLQGYFSDQVEMPELVQCYFNSFHGLHNVLWAKGQNLASKLSNDQLASLLEGRQDYKLYVINEDSGANTGFSSIALYSGRRGRMGDITQTKTTSINASSLLDQTTATDGSTDDFEKIRIELTQKIELLQEDFSRISTTIKIKEQALKGLSKEINELKSQRTEIHKALKEPDAHKLTMKNTVGKLEEGKRMLSKDEAMERETQQKKLQKAIDVQLDLLKKVQAQCHKVLTAYVDASVVEASVRDAATELTQIKSQIKDTDVKVAECRTLIKKVTEEREKAQKDESQSIDELTKLQEKHGAHLFTELVRCTIHECPEVTIGEISAKIDTLRSDLDAAVDNPEIMNQYNATEREHDDCVKEQEALQFALEQADSNMAERMKNWLDHVNNIVTMLSNSFKFFMKALQYEGDIRLRNTGTIDQYEIVVMVSFRTESPMVELSGQRQSGGERAVSTIMYLMALQELTSSPFRVVDEINQGMDERNERLVFDRIVQSCCEGNERPQYFLVSPKLLQGLRAMSHDNVTALMVWNGNGVFYRWQLPQIIQDLKRKRDQLESQAVGGDTC